MAKIRGTWKWNEKFYGDWLSRVSYTITAPITFRSNNQTFSELSLFTSPTNSEPVGIRYDNIEVRSLNIYENAPGEYYTEAEFNEEYRVMEFGTTEQEIEDDIYDFITRNASLDMVAEKLLIAAEKIPQVYDAGKQAEYDAFWDTLQNKGARVNYQYAFSRWTGDYFCPKYKIVPTEEGGAKNIFHYFRAAKKLEAKYIDLSQVPRGTNEAKSYAYSFCSSGNLEEIEDIGLYPSYSYEYAFAYNVYLKKIAMIRVDAETRLANAFKTCLALEEVYFDGEIGRSFSISDSTKLKRASIENVINHLSLSPSIASGQTLTLSKKAVDAAIDGNIWSEEQQGLIYVKGRGSETDTWQNLIAGVVNAGWAITLV